MGPLHKDEKFDKTKNCKLITGLPILQPKQSSKGKVEMMLLAWLFVSLQLLKMKLEFCVLEINCSQTDVFIFISIFPLCQISINLPFNF